MGDHEDESRISLRTTSFEEVSYIDAVFHERKVSAYLVVRSREEEIPWN